MPCAREYRVRMPARRFRITGRVQGVFFRATTKEQADALLLRGWVRNSGDGGVEVYAEGSREAIDTLARWLHRGPAAARVENVETTDVNPLGCRDFSVLK